MIEVEQDDELIALVWFHLLYPKIIECHAVSHPDVRGRWLTRELFDTISHAIKVDTDCSACVAQVHTPNVARLWKRFGFDIYPTFAILKVKEPEDGSTVRREQARPDSPSPDQGS